MDSTTRRRLILDSDYGRQFGWAVELDGRVIAHLEDAIWDSESQFWHHYRLTPLTDDPVERELIFTREWWNTHLPNLVFRNLRLGEAAPHAFPSGRVFDENRRVWMRGLYLSENHRDDMGHRELSSPIQVAAILSLWTVWGFLVWYVVHRQQILRSGQRYYDNPALIYSLLVLCIPLPIVVAGVLYLERFSGKRSRGEQIAYWTIALATLLGFFVLMAGIALSLLLEGSIRE